MIAATSGTSGTIYFTKNFTAKNVTRRTINRNSWFYFTIPLVNAISPALVKMAMKLIASKITSQVPISEAP